MTSVIKIQNLTKTYQLYSHPIDRLKEALSPIRKKYHQDFNALEKVDIDIKSGECVGIIGMNGSGKSTLLQIIAGVLTPTTGSCETEGKIAALLELGSGFNPEFSGMENIFFQCSIMGYKKQETEQFLQEILEFADIGDFIHQPVKTYSSGMYVRLAFAVAINVNPDILIVDEALAVGDTQFQSKCLRKIREFRAKGKTLLFVSHDPGAVKSLCQRAYLLSHGKVVDSGEPSKVFNYYNSLLAEKDDSLRQSKDEGRKRSGDGRVQIVEATFCDSDGNPTELVTSGDKAKVKVKYKINETIDDLSIGFLIRDRLGNDIFGSNTFLLEIELPNKQSDQTHEVVFDLDLQLGPNIYNVTVAAHSGDTHINDNYDWINEAAVFKVVADPDFSFAGCSRLKLNVSTRSI